MVELFINGGSFMWPILAIFIIGLIFVGERLIHLISTLKWGEAFASDVTNKLDSSGVLDAQTMCENGNGPISNLLLVGLININKGVSGVEKSIDAQANVEMASLEKNMTWISLCIATAPMLGFLGTVWGMIQAFNDIKLANDISPAIVAGGISVALLTTAFGLVVAVILQVLQNTVLYIIDNQIVVMQKATTYLLQAIEEKSNE